MAKQEVVDAQFMREVAVELLAMALFIWVGTGAAVSTGEFLALSEAPSQTTVARILPIAFAFGVGILVLVFAFGHISGGHINPAVTLCLTLVGECSPLRCGAYMMAQMVGSVLGSLLVWASTSNMAYGRQNEEVDRVVGNPPFDLGANGLNPTLHSGNGFVLEFMGTFLLCVTVLTTVLHPNSLAQGKPANAPIAIGFAVFLAHVVLIPLTGCGINPARTFGPAFVNTMAGNNVWTSAYWIYFIGPFLASFAAAGLFTTLLRPIEEPTAIPRTAVQQDTGSRPVLLAKV